MNDCGLRQENTPYLGIVAYGSIVVGGDTADLQGSITQGASLVNVLDYIALESNIER